MNKTIKIQKQRLRIFEESKNENYSRSVETRATASWQPPGPTSCCSQPPPSCCRHCPHISRNECSPTSQDILHQISTLATDIETIKSTLNRDDNGSPKPVPAPAPAGPSALSEVSTPPNSDEIDMTTEPDDEVQEPPADTTVNSIEEFLPLLQEESNLNSNLLTNQLK